MLNGHYHRKRNYQSPQHVGEEVDGGMKHIKIIRNFRVCLNPAATDTIMEPIVLQNLNLFLNKFVILSDLLSVSYGSCCYNRINSMC